MSSVLCSFCIFRSFFFNIFYVGTNKLPSGQHYQWAALLNLGSLPKKS